VSKSYGTRRVLDRVGFTVGAGEFVGLAGLNGAGKTTVLKCLLDFCHPDAGRVSLFGRAPRDPASRRGLAFLPERFAAPWYLTGRDFLRYSASLQGTPWSEADTLAMADRLELERSSLDRPARQYSKGMVQKLGLAATFLGQRPLLVLDEPMSGLDPQARASVKKLLAGARQAGRTVLFTTHALGDIAEICDRMIVLHRGVPYFVGTPRELCQHFDSADIEHAFLRCIEGGSDDRSQEAEPADR